MSSRGSGTPSVSVVLPLANCQDRVKALVDEAHRVITAKIPGSEIIAVDALSRDDTWSELRALASRYEELKIFRLKESASYGTASIRGFLEAAGIFIYHQEPHCPWKMEVFWEMARLRAMTGSGVVFALRTPGQRRFRERLLDRLLRDESLADWGIEIPDTGAPAQLFSKLDFEKIHILVPSNVLAPGLVLYLLFQSFNRQVMTLTPEERFQQPGARREAPTLLTSYGQLKAGSEQVRSLRRNLHRIRGLMDI